VSGPFRSPSLADRPHRPATRRRLGRPLPHQLPDGPHAPPPAPYGFHRQMSIVRGISTPFGALFPTCGQVRTCSSAVRHSRSEDPAFDLHALGTPPALILSQDQTRQKMVKLLAQISPRRRPRCGDQGDARSTRQLVRCAATKKRAGCWLQPTRLGATVVQGLHSRARRCRFRQKSILPRLTSECKWFAVGIST
jgi:hypothetical protein